MVLQRLTMKEDMTEVECNLAQYILEHAEDVAHMTAREVGQASYTSASSVLRLCRKVGFESFSEFKMKLAAEYNEEFMKKSVDVNMPFRKGDTPKEIAANMEKIYMQSVRLAYDAIQYNDIEKIVKIIEKSKYIDVYGQGSSLLIASEFCNKMLRIGFSIQMIEQSSSQFYRAMNSSELHCAMIISHSGSTKENIRIANLLKERKVPIIVITSNQGSELAKCANYVIYTATGEKEFLIEKIEIFQSQLAVYYLLDCLYAIIYSKDYDRNMVISKENEQILKIIRNN